MSRWILTAAATALAATPALADALKGKPGATEILAKAPADAWFQPDPEQLLYIELERGRVVVLLPKTLAPNHVKQVKALARSGFYDGLSFYRVIDGFVAQGGDPFEERPVAAPAVKALKAEFEQKPPEDFAFEKLPDEDGYAPEVGFADGMPVGRDPSTGAVWGLHCAGAFAFGRNDARDTASTEFYVALQPQRYLDRNMTVFGRVIFGMDLLQALRRISPPEKKTDDIGDRIRSIRVAADVPEAERTRIEVLRTDTETFRAYAGSKRNRPEAFFYFRPDHVDVCQLQIPTRAPKEPPAR